jgi:hypothetical protein
MNLDELNSSSRDFYERSLMKMNISLVLAAFAFVCLGFCTIAATRSKVNQQMNTGSSHYGTSSQLLRSHNFSSVD